MALVIALAIALGHTVAAIFVPWFWIAVIAVAIVFVSRASHNHRDR